MSAGIQPPPYDELRHVSEGQNGPTIVGRVAEFVMNQPLGTPIVPAPETRVIDCRTGFLGREERVYVGDPRDLDRVEAEEKRQKERDCVCFGLFAAVLYWAS